MTERFFRIHLLKQILVIFNKKDRDSLELPRLSIDYMADTGFFASGSIRVRIDFRGKK